MLVQAPSATGCYVLQDARFGPLLFINVTGTSTPMKFPGTDSQGKITTESDYPPMPAFLADITSAKPHDKPIVYGSRKDSTELPPDGNKLTLRQFTIDNTQFTDGRVDQRMKLGDAEEWKIENTDTATGISHPFHIHVNPFQVVQSEDCATGTVTKVNEWRDTVAVEAGKKLTIRMRFRDFAGELTPDDEVVLCITGNGLKTTEAVRDVLPEAPVIAPKVREVAALVERSAQKAERGA